MSNKSEEQKRIERTAEQKIKRARTTRQGTFGAASVCRSLSDDEIIAWVKENLDYLKNYTRKSINRHK
jgi:hypothetical protein